MNLDKWIEKAGLYLAYVAGVVLFFDVFLTTYDSIGRYLFNSPLLITTDLSSQILLAATFLGAAYVGGIRGFVRIDIFYDRMSLLARRIIDIFSSACCITFVVFILWKGIEQAIDAAIFRTLSSTVMMWPLLPSYIMICLGSLWLILQEFVNIRGVFRRV